MTETVRITRLYPSELDLGGDQGNIEALTVRLKRAGVDLDYRTHAIGDGAIADTDLLVLGTGPGSIIDRVLADAVAHRAELEALVAGGAPVLAIGTGAEILGRSLTTLDGVRHDGVGVVPMTAQRIRERRIGYVTADSPVGELVGFEDHASQWSADAGATAFGVPRVGNGVVTIDGGAAMGLRAGDVFALHMQGPLLPLNPKLTDLLLERAAAHAGVEYAEPTTREPIDDYADGARAMFPLYIERRPKLSHIRV